jgi:membrane protein YdbS with pleckstrin-like domain
VLPEPDQRLPLDAVSYWRARLALQALVVLVAALAVAGVLPAPWRWLVPVLVAVGAVAAIAVVPPLRHRRWRYAVRDEEIDLRHGTFVVRRTLVPMRRVQHVDTEAGPLLGSFSLAAVAFHTAAGATTIPALEAYHAEQIRARVAELARGG